jgi:CRP/FNR family cyclic AMP-dependent transcriptional regulator
MTAVEGLGFLAAGLVLVTFCMKRVVPLRGAAITSNLAFILYGYIAGIEPVLVLHLILLPINVIRLVEALGVSLPSVLSAAIRQRHPRPLIH